MKHPAGDQPLDLQLDAREDDTVEVTGAMLEGERVGVWKVGDNEEVDLGGEAHHGWRFGIDVRKGGGRRPCGMVIVIETRSLRRDEG